MTTTVGPSIGRPERDEAAQYYFGYIHRVEGADIMQVLEAQLEPTLAFLEAIPEERSLYRYAAGKWSMRELLSHVSDTERVFAFRAFWFARGFETPLPSFDEAHCAAAAQADQMSWGGHIAEFRAVRMATLELFRHLPLHAWMSRGVASGNPFTVRALAYIAAGHVTHHLAVLEERYLKG